MSHLGHILLVEDDPRDAEMTLAALAENRIGNEVIHVEDGPSAMDYLLEQGRFRGRPSGNPVLILLDLKLPKMDGLEVLRAIRADVRLSLIPVVMLTSSAEERDRLSSYRLGANAFVVKPLDFDAFFRVVGAMGAFWALVNTPPPSLPVP